MFCFKLFFWMLVLIIIYHWKTPDASATEIYHTWITFIIHNTSLGYVTTLREYPSHPFEGNRFPTDFTDSNGRILPTRFKLMVDWTTHLNQNMHKWTGFILNHKFWLPKLPRQLTGFVIPIRNITGQDVLCFFSREFLVLCPLYRPQLIHLL